MDNNPLYTFRKMLHGNEGYKVFLFVRYYPKSFEFDLRDQGGKTFYHSIRMSEGELPYHIDMLNILIAELGIMKKAIKGHFQKMAKEKVAP